jgi:hypothetical protein
MYQKLKGLAADKENFLKCMSLKLNKLLKSRCPSSQKTGGENEGMFHDVIENKWRKYVRKQAFHDVDENK